MIMETHPTSRSAARQDRAFSLVEVLAAITIIGIIAFLAVPNIVRVKQDGEDNLARARAESLNMAMAAYVQAIGTNTAQSNWAAANSDGRYQLIRQYIAFSETTLTNFTPNGYAIFLTNSTISPLTSQSKAVVTGPSGTTISY